MNDEVLTSIISNCERQGARTQYSNRCVDVCVQTTSNDTHRSVTLQTPLLTTLMQQDPYLQDPQTTSTLALFRKAYDLFTNANKVSVSVDGVGRVYLHNEPDGVHATYRFRK